MLSSSSALLRQRAVARAGPALRASVQTSSTTSDDRKVTSENKKAARQLNHTKNEVSSQSQVPLELLSCDRAGSASADERGPVEGREGATNEEGGTEWLGVVADVDSSLSRNLCGLRCAERRS